MKLFNLFGRKTDAPPQEIEDDGDELEIYSGMRVEVTAMDGRMLFVAKLMGLHGNQAELHQYSEADISQEEPFPVRIRGYSDRDRKAVYMEGVIAPLPQNKCSVTELKVCRIGNDRAFFRLDTNLDATATMFSGLSMGEKPCRLRNISIGGACISSECRYYDGDKFLLKVRLLEDRPESAMFSQVIFDMRLQGDSFRKIARTLNEEDVPSPRGFYYMAEGRPNLRGETPYWNDVTVKTILRNEVYLGHMVQNKTGTVSYKVHKQVSKPKKDWIKVEHTHEPLVSQEVWDAVQRLDNHPSRGRSGSDGEISLFAGVLYCADCGGSMRYQRDYRSRKRHADGHFGEFKAYTCNRYMSGGKAVCSSHYINFKTLTRLLLLDIHAKAMLAQKSPAALKEKILAQKNAASMEQTKALRATLAAVDKRLIELEKLVVSAYEDKVKGVMPEALCIQLMNRYEDERRSKLEQRTQLTTQLEATQEDEQATDEWLAVIRDYAQLEELDRPTLLRLVKRIEVGEKYEIAGETHRDIKIYYNFVGYVEL